LAADVGDHVKGKKKTRKERRRGKERSCIWAGERYLSKDRVKKVTASFSSRALRAPEGEMVKRRG